MAYKASGVVRTGGKFIPEETAIYNKNKVNKSLV